MDQSYPPKRALVLLERWRGANAKLWTYSVTHHMLELRLQRETAKEYLIIKMDDVAWLCCPTSWPDACLVVSKEGVDDWGDVVITLRDAGAGVEIRGGIFGATEHYDPHSTLE